MDGVSFVVPVRNGAIGLADTLASIAASDRSGSNCRSARAKRAGESGPPLKACACTRRKHAYSSAVTGRSGNGSAMMESYPARPAGCQLFSSGKMERGPRATDTICG